MENELEKLLINKKKYMTNKKINKKRVYVIFLLLLNSLILFFDYLINPLKFSLYIYYYLILFTFTSIPLIVFLLKPNYLTKYKYMVYIPFLAFFILMFRLLYFNYYNFMELLLIFLNASILIIAYLILFKKYFENNIRFFRNLLIICLIIPTIIYGINLVSFLPSNKENYYVFSYYPWNSIKINVTYIWYQPVIGVKWKDKILKNGSITKIPESYVKNYIPHQIKEVIRYNFFTKKYLVKVEGLKNESNWLVVTDYYQFNRSVANWVECYFEIGEAPHKSVEFYEDVLLKIIKSDNLKEVDLEKLFPFTQFKSREDNFSIKTWLISNPLERVYLFKFYFIPMGSEFEENKGLCNKFKKKKSIEYMSLEFIRKREGDKNEK